MTSATVAYESCFDSLHGTPTRSRADAPTTAPTPKRGRTPASRSQGDRFIPQRSAMDLDVSHFEITRTSGNENAGVNASPAKEEYKKELAANLFAGGATNKVLAFKNKAPKPTEDHQNSLRVLYTQNRDAGLQPKRYSRHIPQASGARAPPLSCARALPARTKRMHDRPPVVPPSNAHTSPSPTHPDRYHVTVTDETPRPTPQAPERILDAPELLDDYYLNLLDWNSSNVLGVALGLCLPLPPERPAPRDTHNVLLTRATVVNQVTRSTCGTRPTARSSS